jgi:hypothetical protein
MQTAIKDIYFIEDRKYLVFNYDCRTSQVTYSVADFGGNVLIRGDFRCLQENKIPIRNFRAGLYTLCIVDGDQLITNRIKIDQ